MSKVFVEKMMMALMFMMLMAVLFLMGKRVYCWLTFTFSMIVRNYIVA